MNGTFQALAWTLIHFCWQATVIGGFYLAVSVLFKRASSQIRYLFTLAALFSMLIASVATLGYETVRCSVNTSFQVNHSPNQALAISSISTLAANGALLAKEPAHVHLTPMLPWIDCAWLLGVLCFSMRSIGGWWWLQRLRRKTTEEPPATIQTAFLKLRARLGITRLIDLRISECVSVPMTIGVLRPLVLLPASALLGLNLDQLEAIFAHELAHVRRADYFWNLIQTMVETLFFFHPIVWWIGRRLREQRELCCDDIALEMCSDPMVYATALLRVEEQRSEGLKLAMALDGHQPSTLRVRILRIFGEALPQPQVPGLRPFSLIAIWVVVLLFLSPLSKAFDGRASQHPRKEQLLDMKETSTKRSQAMELLALQVPNPASTAGKKSDAQEWNAGAALRPPNSEKLGQVQVTTNDTSDKNIDYISQMRAAGYNVDMNRYITMKASGITPEYAREMANLGFGIPPVNDLVVMKEHGVTPKFVSTLRATGMQFESINDLVSCVLFDVTPEFIGRMKAAGFDSIPARRLGELRAIGVTPEYARAMKQQFPSVTARKLMGLWALHIDDAFIAQAKSHGFAPLTIQKLEELRGSGVMTNEIPSSTTQSEEHKPSD
jgi:beta-lactamase regulating signal transducer with metallopeptidase domain